MEERGSDRAVTHMQNISIIVPVNRECGWLIKSLQAVFSQDRVPGGASLGVIMVNDGYGEFEAVKDAIRPLFADRNITFLSQPKGGPAKARNLGISSAGPGIICFLDDDSVPERDWLSQLLGSFERGADLVSGKTLSLNRDKGSFPYLLERSVYAPGRRFATCNIAYRKEVLDKIGVFDESFKTASWEDNDLGIRAVSGGFKYVYNPGAVVYHDHERSEGDFREKCSRNGRGLAVLSRKYALRSPLVALLCILLTLRWLPLYFVFPFFRGDLRKVLYLRFAWSYYSLTGALGTWKQQKG
ncbi:MAG: glycosyltransferase [Candidatus Omnitrophota bacterium]